MIPRSTTITESGRRTRRALILMAAGILALNLIAVLVDAIFSDGVVSGPSGSTYVTTAGGAAALAGTLERLGMEIHRSRARLEETPLDPDATLVLVEVDDAEYTPDEMTSIRAFLEGGGRLVIGGRAGLVEGLVPDPPRWQAAGVSDATLDLDGFSTSVALSGFGSLQPAENDVPVLVGSVGTVVGTVRRVGDGLIVWVADSGPFLNETIRRRQSAAALFALLGPDRIIVFDEYRHGFADDGGLWQIIPPSWRMALVLGGLTLLAALAAYGRRFGPPQDVRRRLPPDRSRYLEAVAGMMRRGAGARDATEVLREEARRRLERSAGHSSGDLEAVARQAGLDDETTAAVLGSSHDATSLVAVDRALATLAGSGDDNARR